MFRRYCGNCYQPASRSFYFTCSRIFLHIVHQEVCSPLHYRIVLCQEQLVACIEIVLPQMRGEPCTARGEHAPCGTVNRTSDAPYVGIVVCHPSVASIHGTGCLGTRLAQVTNHTEKWLLCLSQVTHQGRPVVHLCIDVNGVFGIPWRHPFVVPYALQVSRLTARL